jgi:hypothetical protein
MSLSVQSLVTIAFQQPGIIQPEEELDGDNGILGVTLLNNIVAQLNVDQMFPFSRMVYDFVGYAPKNSYTIGIDLPAADIPIVRPAFVNRCLYFPTGNTMPMNVQQVDLPDLLYRRRTISAIGSPMYFAVDGGYPLTTLYFDIKPQQGSQFTFIMNKPIPEVGIDDTLMVPPEYSDILICALARRASVVRQMPTDTQANMEALYNEALQRIRTMNGRSQLPLLDDLTGSGNFRTNNIYSGQSLR